MSKKLHINEQLLVDLLYANNRQAFSFVHDTFSPELHGSIIDLIDTDKEGVGVMLDGAFSLVWQSLQSYEERQQKLFAWLLHMMQQLAFVALKQLNRWPTAEELERLSMVLHGKLLTIQSKQKRVIELIYDEGYSKTQIAETMSISVETVDELLREGLRQLRLFLKTYSQVNAIAHETIH